MGQYYFSACTDIGKVRFRNEDNLLVVVDRPVKIFAVADGMGGHSGGDVASTLALDVIKNSTLEPRSLDSSLTRAINDANDEILQRGKESHELEGMGTSITVIAASDDRCIIAHVGDSRAYLYRQDTLTRLTDDHSLVEELVRRGKITPREALEHPQKHILTQALGSEGAVNIETSEITVQDGDKFLLCTDGLTGLVTDEDIECIIGKNADLTTQARKLIDEANKNGGFDNITVILIKYTDSI